MFRMEDGAGQVQDLHHLDQAQGPEAGHQDHHLQGRLPHHQEVVEVDLHGLADHLDRHLVQQDLVAGLQHQERLQVKKIECLFFTAFPFSLFPCEKGKKIINPIPFEWVLKIAPPKQNMQQDFKGAMSGINCLF